MSFYDNSSLAFLPSSGAGKDGKAYSIKPTDGTGDFTFSRGSNLAATRVGPTGLIEKGRENLLLQSNQFDTTWTDGGTATLTSSQSGYDGSNDAWLLEALSTSFIFYQNVSSSGVCTFSVYAKAGTTDKMAFYVVTSPSTRAGFDLSSGTIDFTLRDVDASIEDVGNGWYRCSMTFEGASTSVRIYPTDSSLSPAIGDNIYIQDAQLEIGLAATDYIESGATTGKAGLLEDEPRFDYSGGATCPSLLLEPSRTNIVRQSEYIDGYGVKISCTSTPNYGTSPEGLTNSTRLQFTGNGYTYEAIPQVNGTQYTISVYAKRNDSGTQSFGFFVNGSGAIDSAMALTNEWKRFDYTYTATNNIYFGFAGNSGADVSVYGFQQEAGSYPTSYIPNHSGGTITRGADVCTGAGDSSTFNSTEGVLYAEIADIADGGANRAIAISDGTTSNVVRFYYSTTANRIVGNVKSVGTNVFNFNNALTDSANFIKIALSYKANDFKMYVNGVLVATDTSGNAPIGLNELSFDNGGNFDDFYGKTKQVLVFPTALSDADLATLTTI